MRTKLRVCSVFTGLLAIGFVGAAAHAQGTAFVYQGQLSSANAPANGSFDLTFALFTSSNGVGQVGGTLTNLATPVSNGLFSATLNFGSGVFTGGSLWLQMGVRTNGSGAFTTLTPLQPLLPVPYAIFANGASNLLGTLPAGQLSGTLPVAQLPGVVVTNNQTGVAFNGAVSATNITAGTGANLWMLGSSGSSTGGNVTVAAGNAGVATGGSGGTLNLQAGNAMAAGGSGYSGLGPAGNVNITAGSGYNSVGGNVTIQSGGNSPWDLSANQFSKVSLLGGIMNAGDNAEIDVESGHNTTYGSPPQNSAGGNVKIIGGTSTTGFSGGNILLLPGTGTPNGFVGINKAAPTSMLDVNGTVAATGFTGNGSGLTGINAAQLTGTISATQLPATVVTNNGTAPVEQVLTNFAIPSYIAALAVNPVLNKVYLSGGASAAQQIVIVDGNTFGQTGVGSGMGVDVDITNNNYWSGGVYSDNVTVWNSANAAITSVGTGAGCTFELSIDAPHRRAWAGAQCSDSVWVFNADTYALINGPIIPGGTMGQLLVNPATGRAYINAGGASKRVNPSTFAVTANSFGTVLGVNGQSNRLYAHGSGNTLQILDGSPDPEVVLTNVTLPYSFGAYIGVNPGINEIYVQQSTNQVYTLDAGTGVTLATVNLGATVTSLGNIAVDASRNRVYVVAYVGGAPNLYVLQVTIPSGVNITGTVAATSFSGNGGGLTNLNYNGFTNAPSVANLVLTNDTRSVRLTNSANQFAGAFTGNLNGATNLPLAGLQSGGAVNAQVLTWNGASWAPSNAPAGGTGGGLPTSAGNGTNESFFGTTTFNGPMTGTNLSAGSAANLWLLGSSGGSAGGNITLMSGSAGTATGGSGGNLNLQAGNAMASGGSGYGGLGPAGNVNITAGSGYNSVGGNIVLQSGGNSPWDLSANQFSKVALLGGTMNGGDNAEIDVESAHNTSYGSPPQNSAGGNVKIVGGTSTTGYPGGNILLLPGTGTPNGNVGIGTNAPVFPLEMGSGAYCSVAGVWTSVSDRNAKENFAPVSPAAVLEKVAELPITEWKYKIEADGVKHLGPVAQDFHAAFGLGDSDKAIGSIDETGVALAAIQGLNQKLEEQKAENAALKARLERLERLLRNTTAH